MIGHKNEGVELIAALGAIVVDDLEESVCVRVSLEDTAAIRGHGGDEEGAEFGGERGGHEARVTGRRRAE